MVSYACTSLCVPSVAVPSACVCPRVNSAEPCVPRQHPHLDGDRAHRVGVAAVAAHALAQDHLAHRALLDVLEHLAGVLVGGLELGRELLDHLGLHRLDRRVALALVGDAQRLAQAVAGGRLHALAELGRHLLGRPLHRRGDLDLGHQVALDLHQLLDPLVGHGEPLGDRLLGHLEGAALHHHDRVFAPRHDHVQLAVLELLEGGVQHPLPLDAADAHRGDRAREGDAGKHQRHAGAGDPQHVGVVLLVGADHGDEHLRLVGEAVGEERAQRAVDQPRRQDLLVRRAPLALDEAAGELARGVGPLAVFHREGEEREVRGVVLRRGGAQHHRLPEHHGAAPVGLTGHLPRLDRERASRELPDQLGHVRISFLSWLPGEGPQVLARAPPRRRRRSLLIVPFRSARAVH
jgi:hypothetical protein